MPTKKKVVGKGKKNTGKRMLSNEAGKGGLPRWLLETWRSLNLTERKALRIATKKASGSLTATMKETRQARKGSGADPTTGGAPRKRGKGGRGGAPGGNIPKPPAKKQRKSLGMSKPKKRTGKLPKPTAEGKKALAQAKKRKAAGTTTSARRRNI